MQIISFRGATIMGQKWREKLHELFCDWKQRKWERDLASVTTAEFYHITDKDLEELEKILDEARERIRGKEK